MPAIVLIGLSVLPSSAWAQSDTNDPLEPFNRAIFGFNQVVDGLILDPAQQLYDFALPDPAKTGVRNFLDNLASPVTFLNDVFQGERERAGITLSRFLVNSTFGMGGIFDAASGFGIEARHSEDFGQTLGVYGVDHGPYLVLPLLGPSSVRDAFGRVVDMQLTPWGYVVDGEVMIGTTVVDGIDTRYRLDPVLDDLSANSLDLYSATRSVYLQRRTSDVLNGATAEIDDSYEDIFDEDF